MANAKSWLVAIILVISLVQLTLFLPKENRTQYAFNELSPQERHVEADFVEANEALILLGIHVEDWQQQQQIRETYLRYYRDSFLGFPMDTVCSVASVLSSPVRKDCRILYAFYSSQCAEERPQNDVVCLVNNATMDGPPSMSWFKHVRERLHLNPFSQIDWIGHVDSQCMLRPSILIDAIDQAPVGHNSSMFATTPFINLVDCMNKEFQHTHTLDCRRTPSGRVYALSKELLKEWQPTSLSQPQTRHRDDDVNFRAFLLQEYNPRTLSIPRQPQVQVHDWKRLWEQLVHLANPNKTMATEVLWRDLPVTYVSAKFGKDKDTFQPVVEERRVALIWNYGWKTQNLNTYSSYPDWIEKDPRWKPHLAFRTNSSLSDKGAGFWFWKGPLIRHHFQDPSTKWLLYTDVDLFDHMEWITDLMSKLEKGGYDMALYHMPYLEQVYTKPAVFQHFCANHKSPLTLFQHAANFLVFRVSEKTTLFVEDWIRAMSVFEWINDDVAHPADEEPRNGTSNSSKFQEHRHDQSLLSVLLSCRYLQQSDKYEGAFTLDDWTVQMIRLKDATG